MPLGIGTHAAVCACAQLPAACLPAVVGELQAASGGWAAAANQLSNVATLPCELGRPGQARDFAGATACVRAPAACACAPAPKPTRIFVAACRLAIYPTCTSYQSLCRHRGRLHWHARHPQQLRLCHWRACPSRLPAQPGTPGVTASLRRAVHCSGSLWVPCGAWLGTIDYCPLWQHFVLHVLAMLCALRTQTCHGMTWHDRPRAWPPPQAT